LNLLFAWRYFKAKKSTNAINFITRVSTAAIIIITAAFIVILSVFNGFESLVKSLYSSFYCDISVSPATGKSIFISDDQLVQLKSIPNVKAYSLIVEDKALLQNGEIQTVVQLKGVDENYGEITSVPQKIVRGKFNLGTGEKASIVLGSGIENALGLQSDRNLYPVTAYIFRRGVNVNSVDPYDAFSAENVSTTGTFYIQQDIDNTFAITNVDFMKKMLSMKPREYGSIEVALKNPAQINDAQKAIGQIFGSGYLVKSRFEQNQSLFSTMILEKWVMYGILTMMLVVASFTMIGSLTMLVLEKQKDIQVLKALGADNARIRTIFLTEGLMLAALGSVTGILLAVIICWAQVKFKLININGGTFLIDYYPVKMIATDILLVMITVIVIAFLASWFPARKASVQPVTLKS